MVVPSFGLTEMEKLNYAYIVVTLIIRSKIVPLNVVPLLERWFPTNGNVIIIVLNLLAIKRPIHAMRLDPVQDQDFRIKMIVSHMQTPLVIHNSSRLSHLMIRFILPRIVMATTMLHALALLTLETLILHFQIISHLN